MNFISILFFIFFLIVLGVCYFLKNDRQKRWLLFLANIFFVGFADWHYLLVLFFITLVVYEAALSVHKSKAALYLGIILPLAVLVFFKYLNPFCSLLSSLFGCELGTDLTVNLPLGISFYTFLALSYLLDVYHKKLPPEANFLMVALYISFFPALISGPITKARDLLGQLHQKITINCADMQVGLQLILIGGLKKYVVADRLGILVGDVYHAPLAFDSATVWLAVISYSLQLYLDFAGYSDIAIGCARCLGYRLCENFNMPYLAENISEFWKRWHISLSSWLQEYLYFTLGGSRCARLRSCGNLLLTMVICGLWHGGSWNFLLWGLAQGILLVVHKLYRDGIGRHLKLPLAVKLALTYLSVTGCWVLFRGTDMQNIREIFYRLFVWETFGVHQMLIYSWIAIALFIAVSLLSYFFYHGQGPVLILNISRPRYFFVFCLEALLFLCLIYTHPDPFAYAVF